MEKSIAFSTVLGFVVSTASSFVLPLPSLVESSGHEIAARRAHRAAHGSPSPRVTTASPSERRTVSPTSRESLWNVDPVVSRLPQPGLTPTGVQPNEKRGEARTDGRSPDFEVNLGRVISTLRNDYPRLFFDAPSFDIFTEDIELRDPVSPCCAVLLRLTCFLDRPCRGTVVDYRSACCTPHIVTQLGLMDR